MYPTSQLNLEAGGKDIITNIKISKSKTGKTTCILRQKGKNYVQIE